MLKKDISRNSLLKLALFGFVLAMPFTIKYNSIFVILTGVLWLSKLTLVQDVKDTLRQPPFLILFIFFSLYLLGVLLSDNTRAALSELELKSTMLLLPLAFTSAHLSKKECNNYLKAFVAANVIATIICYTKLFYKIFVLDHHRSEGHFLNVDWVYFSYFLPRQLDFHTPYFSMYTTMAAIVAAYFFMAYAITKQRKIKIIGWAFALLYLLLFTLLLASRTALISGIFILAIGFLSTLLYYRKYLLATLSLFFIVVVSVAGIYNTPYLKQKLSSGTGMEQRSFMWQGSFNLIAESPVLGIGTGDVKDRLVTEYEQLGFTEGVVNQMDPHNQYLQLLVALGVVGLLVFLAFLFQLIFVAARKKIYILAAFTMLIILCSLTESILGTQKGVVFVSFFTALLIAPKHKKNQLISDSSQSAIF